MLHHSCNPWLLLWISQPKVSNQWNKNSQESTNIHIEKETEHNSTCNIQGHFKKQFSSVHRHQESFEEALAEAQALGYAETDPSLDVEGFDAKYKLCIILLLVSLFAQNLLHFMQ